MPMRLRPRCLGPWFPVATALALLAFALPVRLAAQALSVSATLYSPAHAGSPYDDGDAGDSTQPGGAVVSIFGGTAPYTCSLTAGTLPSGMSLTEVAATTYPKAFCVLSGTPASGGGFPLTIKVTDSASASVSQNVAFTVYAATPLVFSSIVTNADAGGTTETITWTTSIPATSYACYSIGNSTNFCTTETDLAGVTSHSLTLTGLFPNTQYGYDLVSRGVVGGVPQDYLMNLSTYGTANFTTAAGTASGTTTMGMILSGPNNITQGSPIYVGVYYAGLVNPTPGVDAQFIVTNLPPFTQVHWPDQQDYGYSGGVVSTTNTTNDTLTLSGLGGSSTTQFELLTNVGGTTALGDYTVDLTGNVTNGGSTISTSSATWGVNVNALSFTPGTPSSYPPIPALATWQSQMVATYPWYNAELLYAGACVTPADDHGIQFYDGAWVYDQIGMYTKNLSYWSVGANAGPCPYAASTTESLVNGGTGGIPSAGTYTITPASMTGISNGITMVMDNGGTGFEEPVTASNVTGSTFDATFIHSHTQGFPFAVHGTTGPQGAAAPAALYHQYIVGLSYSPQGYWNFPDGLYYACTQQASAQGCSDLHGLANGNNGNLVAEDGGRFDVTNTRETAYALGLRRLDYDQGGGSSTLAEVKALVNYNLGSVDGIVNGQVERGAGCYGFEEAFMDGLLADELIKYYNDPQTGNQADPRIPPAIQALADHVWATLWIPRTGDNGYFLYGRFGCDTTGQIAEDAGGSDLRSLNLLIAPLFAWVYKETGQAIYQKEGDAVWNSGVTTAVNSGLGWSGKNFSQQYRWSFGYPLWRSAPTSVPSIRLGGRHGVIFADRKPGGPR